MTLRDKPFSIIKVHICVFMCILGSDFERETVCESDKNATGRRVQAGGWGGPCFQLYRYEHIATLIFHLLNSSSRFT